MHSVDYAVARCLNACLSVRLLHAGILSKRLNMSSVFLSSGSDTTLVFFVPNGLAIFWREPLNGATNAGGMKKIRIFDQYLAVSSKQYKTCHSYYRSRIGNHTQAFDWYQFQWPWVTSNPDFKVTRHYSTSNNSKNDTRLNYLYNGRPIGNWPWTTPNPR